MRKYLLFCFLFILLYGISPVIFSKSIKSDEEVVFFPTIAHLNPQGKWRIPIHGWIYEPALFGEISQTFRFATGVDSKETNQEQESIFKQRSADFFVDNERRKQISIRIYGQKYSLQNKSKPNGHFSGHVELAITTPEKYLSFRAVTPAKDPRIFEGQVLLVPPKGLSVISDIDDTIKISNVLNKKELLRNTFFRPFKVVPGMAKFYRDLNQHKGTHFHYVSASPWQLFRVLNQFFHDEQFPQGSFHMKTFRWKDRSLANILKSSFQYKVDIIDSICKTFPQRQFLLVGDSGEKDPEIYGEIARRYGKQIRKILIRNVSDEAPRAERFKKAFQSISPDSWQVFKDSQELAPIKL